MNNNIPLDKAQVNIRIKLAALWVAVMFFYIYGDYFSLYIPGYAGKLVAGDTLLDSPIKVFAASVLMSIPCAKVNPGLSHANVSWSLDFSILCG